MTDVDEHGRPEPPLAGDEAATLLGFLDYQRATLTWKCAGLDDAAMRTTVAASAISLGGLLGHLATVEDYWFAHRLHGHAAGTAWDPAAWATDWRPGPGESPERLVARWQDSVARSRALVAEALAAGGLGTPSAVPWGDGSRPSLRWILVHMVEEYARHNGHADLIREAVDGQTGE